MKCALSIVLLCIHSCIAHATLSMSGTLRDLQKEFVRAQDTPNPNVKLMKYYSAWGTHIEYTYLNAHSVGIGANFLTEPLHKRIAGKQILYLFEGTVTGLFYDGKFSLGQRVDLGINCEDLSPQVLLFFEHNNKNDFRVGCRAGISFGNFWQINYRYSYPLGSYENKLIARHGITLTLKWNWVAISDLYGP